MAKRSVLVWLALLGLALACDAGQTPRTQRAPSLAELPLADVKASGLRLMQAPDGLHRLTQAASPLALVAVHGADSQGYEWIYPLHHFAEQGVPVYVYRYDFHACPEPIAEQLARRLDALLAEQPAITQLRLFGHSYGGLVAAQLAARYRGRAALSVDLVASPLAGFESLRTRCKYDPESIRKPVAGVQVRQWRTRKDIDGAFRDLPSDPQHVDIAGSEVVTLPERYRDERLGHNWSISWVADQVRLTP